MTTDFQITQSKTINWLRFPLIVLVVYIHNYESAYDYSPIINWTSITSIDIYEIIRIFFSKVISHIAVPSFFFISGYLFFYKTKEFTKKVYLSKLTKRIYTLLIPYILWNIIAITFDFCNFYSKHNISDSFIHIVNNLWYFFTNPLDYPLWYVRNLIILSLFSPVYYYLLNKWPQLFVCLFILVLLICGHSTNINSIVFFGLGAYLSINNFNIITTFRKIRIPMYIIALITMLLCVYFNSKYSEIGKRIYPIFILSGVISIFNIASFFIEKNIFKESKFLTSSVFFIYAIHILLPISWTDIYFKQAFLLCNDNFILQTIIYLLQPLVKTALCLLLFIAMKTLTPKFVNVLCGNRLS